MTNSSNNKELCLSHLLLVKRRTAEIQSKLIKDEAKTTLSFGLTGTYHVYTVCVYTVLYYD